MKISIKTSQHPITTENFTDEFAACWQAAGMHIESMAQRGGFLRPQPTGKFVWHKAGLHPPFLEHLSFGLGNQTFFVRIEDVDGRMQVPGILDGLLRIANGWQGHACLMPMRNTDGVWRPARPGWGLVHAETGVAVEPPALMTEALVPMTSWELHDFAISIVRNSLEAKGHRIMSYASDPDVNPTLWFVGDSGPECVIVRAAMYPQTVVEPPENMAEIMLACKEKAKKLHFACVIFNNLDNLSLPLFRGQAANCEYDGLVEFSGTSKNGVHGIRLTGNKDGTYKIS